MPASWFTQGQPKVGKLFGHVYISIASIATDQHHEQLHHEQQDRHKPRSSLHPLSKNSCSDIFDTRRCTPILLHPLFVRLVFKVCPARTIKHDTHLYATKDVPLLVLFASPAPLRPRPLILSRQPHRPRSVENTESDQVNAPTTILRARRTGNIDDRTNGHTLGAIAKSVARLGALATPFRPRRSPHLPLTLACVPVAPIGRHTARHQD